MVSFVCLVGSGRVRAQAPTYDTGLPSRPGGGSSSLGSSPGTGGNVLGRTPGGGTAVLSGGDQGGGPISGRTGATGSHVPASVTNPGNASGPNDQPQGISAPIAKPTVITPSYGTYELPAGPEDDGPPQGLTLDQSIERLLKENLDLRGKFYEIPQAQADILNAGLRANPVFYADAQLVPYGRYTRDKPGGQTQYDMNVSYPLDVSRKRLARTDYATRAKRVIEAQYQDAARNAIDQLYVSFVTVLHARQTVRYAEASVKGYTQYFNTTRELYTKDQKNRASVNRVKVQLDTAQVALLDARENLRKANRDLASILNVPPNQAETLEVRGSIEDVYGPPPPQDELVRMALTVRPDVVAYRLGIMTAKANVRLQLANRFSDLYILYQPYTLQDNTPSGLKSPISWALGVTMPLPIYNRNQGGIARAKLNVTQSQIESSTIERQAITEIQQAYKEYEVTKAMVKRIREDIIPVAQSVRDDSHRLFIGGEADVLTFLDAQREFQDTLKQYLDTAVRHRRSMLNLNTVLGQRVLP